MHVNVIEAKSLCLSGSTVDIIWFSLDSLIFFISLGCSSGAHLPGLQASLLVSFITVLR